MFLARARVVQSEVAKAREELAPDGRQGAVAIGVGPVAGITVVPGALTLFRRRFPEARVQIIEALGRALIDLVRDEIVDLGVSRKPDGKLDRALAFRPLYQNALVVAARKGHPLARAGSLSRLAEAEWLSLGPGGTATGHPERVFASAGRSPPRRVVLCDSYNILVAVLAASDAVAIMPRRLLSEAVWGGTCCARFRSSNRCLRSRPVSLRVPTPR
jgi:DNA-binding transcriptional LysR family regulator